MENVLELVEMVVVILVLLHALPIVVIHVLVHVMDKYQKQYNIYGYIPIWGYIHTIYIEILSYNSDININVRLKPHKYQKKEENNAYSSTGILLFR